MGLIHVLSAASASFIANHDSKMVQPNAIDLRLREVWRLETTTFVLDEDSKTPRHRTVVPTDIDGYWHLWPGAYEIRLGDTISIGPEEAGLVIPRSTLNRNGVFITTGLYDSGYTGSMLACLHVTTDLFMVKKDTRLAQFLLFTAEALHQYDGQYQNK